MSVHKECHIYTRDALPSNYLRGIDARNKKAAKNQICKISLLKYIRGLHTVTSDETLPVQNQDGMQQVYTPNGRSRDQPPLCSYLGNGCLVGSGSGLLVLAVIGGGSRDSGRGRRRKSAQGRDRSSGRDDAGGGRIDASSVASSRQTSASRADTGLDQVLEPSTGVELAVDGVDEPGLAGAVVVGDDFHADQTDDRLGLGDRGGVGCDPADDDAVASVPEVETLEVDGWLLALADLELLEAGEGRGEERKRLGGVALRARVDQGIDGLGVVGEVGCEHSVGEGIAVANDQSGVVGCDHVGLSIGDTLARTGTTPLSWCRDCAKNGEREEGDGAEGRHFAFEVLLLGWLKVREVVQLTDLRNNECY